MKNLILVRGVSGSGKTTFASLLAPVYYRFTTDDFWHLGGKGYNFDATKLSEAHEWNRARVEKVMTETAPDMIAVHNTFTTEREMKPYFELAEKYGYRVHTIIVENRHGGVNEHNVPQETLEKQKNRFDKYDGQFRCEACEERGFEGFNIRDYPYHNMR